MYDIGHYDKNLRTVKMPFCAISGCNMPSLWAEHHFHLGGGKRLRKRTRAFKAVRVLESQNQYLKLVSV